MSALKPWVELRPIVVPVDWTRESDFQFYEDRWGKPKCDYSSAALARVAEDYRHLINVVDAALAYFQRKDRRLEPVHPDSLPVREKLAILSVITNTRSMTFEYKSRFDWNLQLAIFAENERRRVLESYYIGEERFWLYPLCQLADWLSCAAFHLDEAMVCEHDDYYEPLSKPTGGQ